MNPKQYLNTKKLSIWADSVQIKADQIFGTFDDRSPKVEVHFIDRTRYEPLHFQPVRYLHQKMRAAERHWRARTVSLNLSLAARAAEIEFDALDRFNQHGRKRP